MRKLYFISRYYGNVNRGVETYVAELSQRLASEFEVEFLKNGISILFKPPGSVIISTNGRLDAILIRIITWIRSQKMIIPGQSGLGFDDRLNLYCFPDVFVSLTLAQNQWSEKINPFVKKAIIPNGVDLQKFKPAKTKPKVPTVGYVAALYPEKRQELLIRAVAKTSAHLILVGDGPDKQKLTGLCQKLLPGRFEIKSYPFRLMPNAYHLMTIFAYPTVPWESFGIAILEALACNIPVVTTNDPNRFNLLLRRDLVGDAGIFTSPEKLTDALLLALKTDWQNKPRLQAEKFSWDLIAQKYLKLINNL